MLSNEQKAARLEEIADNRQARAEEWLVGIACEVALADAALLRECAAMMRERNPEDAVWELEYQRRYRRFDLCVGENFDGKWHWSASYGGVRYKTGDAVSLAAAQAAAVAWVDAAEGNRRGSRWG
jgi:hypothetical protein